jgi:hypothetical protein
MDTAQTGRPTIIWNGGGYSGSLTYNYTPVNTAWWDTTSGKSVVSTNGDEQSWTTKSQSIKPSFQTAAENVLRSNVSSGDLICAVYTPYGIPDGYKMNIGAWDPSTSGNYYYTWYYWYLSGLDDKSDCTNQVNNVIEYRCAQNSPYTKYINEYSGNPMGPTSLNASGVGRFTFFQEYINIDANNNSKFNFDSSVKLYIKIRMLTIILVTNISRVT